MIFKVGDRVAVYGCDDMETFNEGARATVRRVDRHGVYVRYDGDGEEYHFARVHPKQCRRLVDRRAGVFSFARTISGDLR